MRTMASELLEVKELKVYFPVTSGLLRRTTGHVRAVDGISFSLRHTTCPFRRWIERVHDHDPPRRVVLDMDSSVSPTFGEQEGTAYNGHLRRCAATWARERTREIYFRKRRRVTGRLSTICHICRIRWARLTQFHWRSVGVEL